MGKNQDGLNVEILTRVITPDEQGQYLEIEFNVPKGTEQIKVTMDAQSEKDSVNVIDLGVKDPYRTRGWSGGARTEFFVSKSKATPGYLHGELHEGKWAVMLGTYKVAPSSCEVILTVEFTPHQYRWLRGDLHVHSVHSDGKYTLRENAEFAKTKKLDFMGLTDHNTSSQNYSYPRETEVLFIPGMELTTNKGHLNLYGVKDPLLDFRVNTMEELHSRLKEARDKGATISLNHPHCSNTGWEWEWDFDYDWVEVWNGPWREDNKNALEWWHNQLVSGRRLVAVGGSDTHRPDPYVKHGMPTTWVYGDSLTTSGILQAIDTGHVVLSYAPDGPFINLTNGTCMVGDVSNQLDKKVNLVVSQVEIGDVIKVYSNKGVEIEEKVSEEQDHVEMSFDVNSKAFYRVEVWRYFPQAKQNMLAALSNPIYFENQ
ncbi:CehA/McbA family metallohydrolase [Virgibacillus litoralis]|uniref:Polymerase/histidinol phosphatase N-terminal domain-containing protein n=1 Tax=Virgibacillus litoralis TaxID=578221 RepID=A0ABS4HAF1_9BACI|nr:CehA/McbA family metallohydrolase [Virgibacillus litoralis]MBP1947880.1 hypothetical protein [Virgibacillus litoralis]